MPPLLLPGARRSLLSNTGHRNALTGAVPSSSAGSRGHAGAPIPPASTTRRIHSGSATPSIPTKILVQPPELVAKRKKIRSQECALTRKIQACDTWRELQLVLNSETSFNRIHVHVATVRLAGVVHAKNLLSSERTQLDAFIRSKVIPLTDYHMLTFRPWELSSIAWALAMLQYPPPTVWLTEWSGSVGRRLGEFTSKDLSHCLRACATFHNLHKQRHQPQDQQHSPRPSDFGITHKFLDQLSSEVAAKSADFTVQGVSNSIWAYATLLGSLEDAQPAGNLADATFETACAGPLGLAIGKLLARATDFMTLSADSQHAGSSVATTTGRESSAAAGSGQPAAAFNPQELSIMAWGVAVLKAQVQDSWLQQLGRSLAAMQAPQPRHLARGLWALASLHLRAAPDEAVVSALTAALLPHVRLGRLANVDIAQVTWALGKLRFRPNPELVFGMMDAVGQRMASLQPRELAMTLYGLALMGAKPSPGWLPRLCYVAARRWHRMPPMVAATLLASLARMKVRPSAAFLNLAGGAPTAYSASSSQDAEGRTSMVADEAGSSAATTGGARERQRRGEPAAAAAVAAAVAAAPDHSIRASSSGAELAVQLSRGKNRLSGCLLSSSDPRVIAWTIWSLGAMVWPAPKWWATAALDATLRVLPSMPSGHLVRVLCGLTNLQRQRPPKQWSDAVVARLLQVAPELSTEKLVLAAHAMRRLQMSPSVNLMRGFQEHCQLRVLLESGRGQRSAAAAVGSNGTDVHGLEQAAAHWLKIARLGRNKCGSLEVWHQRRYSRLGKLQQLNA